MLNRTFDESEINSVLKHPDIWPYIADGEDMDSFSPPIDEDHHYLYNEGMLFILHPDGDDFSIHANVVPEYRGNALSAAMEAFEYGFTEIKTKRIIAKIDKKYGNVYKFALKSGMKDLGFSDDGRHFLELRA